jgi:hypothetical protein
VIEVHLVEEDGGREGFGVGGDVRENLLEVGGIGELADGEEAAGVKRE